MRRKYKIFSIFIHNDKETIRIISARKANKKEQGAYYGQNR